jgi:PLP dependent protein
MQDAKTSNYLRDNLAEVRRKIERAAAKAGRNANDVKLVAVSKTHSASVLREAIAVGANILGENKVQEAEGKINEIGRHKAEWHLIGHLQSNKARKAVELFDVIHTLDSLKLAERLERICIEDKQSSVSVLVQVDLAKENTKSGVLKEDLSKLNGFLKSCERLKFDGLMIIPPYFDEPELVRPYFKELRELRDEFLAQNAFANSIGELSMGMSHDFEIAIEEGATIVRVGTAIFGERSYG